MAGIKGIKWSKKKVGAVIAGVAAVGGVLAYAAIRSKNQVNQDTEEVDSFKRKLFSVIIDQCEDTDVVWYATYEPMKLNDMLHELSENSETIEDLDTIKVNGVLLSIANEGE